MKTVYSDKHTLHTPSLELAEGRFIENFEKPERAFYVLEQVRARKIGNVIAPEEFPLEKLFAVHHPRYVAFLQEAQERWTASGRDGLILPAAYATQNNDGPEPRNILGQLGHYIADGCAPITPTTWEAVQHSAYCALTAQKLIANGERAAFALCRPPGHHASSRLAAGYCYLNNAAIAAQAFLNDGAKRVAIVDVDYHAGNGTQDIFYDRADVLFTSLHADPLDDYPFFLGHAHERGVGAGEGFNFNYPLPLGTDYARWAEALGESLKKVAAFGPDAVVISLGVDTFKGDPISKFLLESINFVNIGETLAKLQTPTLFVMEGGYAIEDVGINATNVLTGFLSI